ncbi:MAG: hypothetical protein K2P64_07475 [Lachnospiraceae bacterium]|nr:hypothetical protein [Lachnospiraceae bacterium]
MGEALGKVVEALVDVFKRNYKRPKLWFTVGVLIFVIILLIPYIDSNFFYFKRIEKRIDILAKVMSLDQTMINSNQAYKDEYQSILQEIEQQRDRSLNSLMNKFICNANYLMVTEGGKGNRVIKFLTGALWFIIMTICIPFIKTFKKKSDKVIAFVILMLISAMVGGIFSMIPVIISPIVNYVGIPLLQLGIVIIVAIKSNKKGQGT